MALGGFSLKAMGRSNLFYGMNPDNDRILVLIQLNGGNDGLNMLLPLDQYDRLANARQNVILAEKDVLKINDTMGFHKSMPETAELYNKGLLKIVQSVGYPNQNRSHFRSMDIWQTASPAEETWTSGWLGRYFENFHPQFPEGYPNTEEPDPFAITIGNIVSETCQGTAVNYSMTLNDPFSLRPLADSGDTALPDTPYGDELDFLRTTIAQTNAYSDSITAAAEKGVNVTNYPVYNNLAQQLKNVALLISGGLKTNVYVVSLGGFDTHANQVEEDYPDLGVHAELLQYLSEAIWAFHEDMRRQGFGDRVMGMTFSEFGRQIRSNASFGTDHGTAAPLMVFGSCIDPGVLGTNPQIPAEVEAQEGVPMQYDFRDVYGSMLMDWFELEEEVVREILHPDFQHLPIVGNCLVTSTKERDPSELLAAKAYPNPFRDWTTIEFESQGGWVKVSVYNAMGAEVQVLTNQNLLAGQHQLRLDGSRLPAGNYYFRIQHGNDQVTKPLIKQ